MENSVLIAPERCPYGSKGIMIVSFGHSSHDKDGQQKVRQTEGGYVHRVQSRVRGRGQPCKQKKEGARTSTRRR